MAPNPFSSPLRPLRLGRRHRRAGLSLVEVMIAGAMITLTCSVVMFAFTQLNQMCMVSRLYTGASTVAESQIDLIQTDGPFRPFVSGTDPAQTPPVLTTPFTTTGSTAPTTTSTNVTVFQDPISGVTITGTMSTTITPTTTSYANGPLTDTLYLYLGTVTVTYNYRNRQYSIQFSTLRTSDT